LDGDINSFVGGKVILFERVAIKPVGSTVVVKLVKIFEQQLIAVPPLNNFVLDTGDYAYNAIA
jgi:hypothetical protein